MPVDPDQLAQDKDFLAAAPDDQIKYLSAQDPEFAKAPREDQMGYLSHLSGRPVTPPTTAAPTDRLFPAMSTDTKPATLSAPPSGVGGWLQDAENDLRHGGQSTFIGKILHAAGANPNGLEAGVGAKVADNGPGSIPLGLVHAAQGAAEIPSHPLAGALKTGGGLLQAASIPLAFSAPEVTEGLSTLRKAVLPTTEEAGELFQPIEAAAKNTPINVKPARAIADEAARYADTGATLPPVLKKFIARTEPQPGVFPLANTPAPDVLYPEGRMFAQNAGRLSASDRLANTPNMDRLVGKFADALRTANRAAAEQVGMGEQYDQAMRAYTGAAKRKEMLENVTKVAKDYVGKAAIGGAAGAGGYAAWKALQGSH